ncbi:MAG: cupin domain-containing protein [Hyphomicrobiales bacterium]
MNGGLIGGIGLTHLLVYEQSPAPDGEMSGCPHVHAITDEAYYVISGTGRIELHDPEHGFRSVALVKGSYVQFTAGTVHRAVSTGALEVLAIMGNAGLAERGDARIWFGPDVDADPERYAALVRLPKEKGLEGAVERRDRSVEAYMELMRLWDSDRAAYDAELQRFVSQHAAAMAPRRDEFRQVIEQGPARALSEALSRLDSLPGLITDPLAMSADDERSEQQAFGMCGLLRPLDIPLKV